MQPAASLYLWLRTGIQIPLLDARFRPSTSRRQSWCGVTYGKLRRLHLPAVADWRRPLSPTLAAPLSNSNKHPPRPTTPLSTSLHSDHGTQCIEAVSKTRHQTRAHIMEQRRRKYVSKACQQCRQRRAKVCARIVACAIYLTCMADTISLFSATVYSRCARHAVTVLRAASTVPLMITASLPQRPMCNFCVAALSCWSKRCGLIPLMLMKLWQSLLLTWAPLVVLQLVLMAAAQKLPVSSSFAPRTRAHCPWTNL